MAQTESVRRTARSISASSSALALFLAGALGCGRGDRDGVPLGPPTPELPVAPRPAPNPVPAPEPLPERAESRGAGGEAGAKRELAAPLPLAPSAPPDEREAKGEFAAARGYRLDGGAEFDEVASGVKVVVELQHAPPGRKGVHVHERPDCSDIPGQSMGEHFAPNAAAHGLPPSSQRHLGDFGNIEVGKDGRGRLEIVVANANLKPEDPMSFLGRALVVHEREDRGTQPSGGAGKPIACAVIRGD